MNLLAIETLSVTLAGRKVLDDVTLSVAAGEFVGLIGPNGAGKSTLLKAVLGLRAHSGRVTLAGADAAATSSRAGARRRARHVAYLAQERDVAWDMPVEAVVALGRAPHRPAFAPPSRQDRAAVEVAMRTMDVSELAHRPATHLSGGELARVLIARTLAQETPLILADEPTAGLDPAHQIGVMKRFAALAAQGRTVIASMHDLGLAARWCSRLVLLAGGRIAADGSPSEIIRSGVIERVYGVRLRSIEIDGDWIIQPVNVLT